MHLESLRLKNFRAFREVELRDLPRLAVFVGANGTGKSTLFSVFQLLREAMASNVTDAVRKLGGSRGLQELRTRDCTGPIEIELMLRVPSPEMGVIRYTLHLDEEQGRPLVELERLDTFPTASPAEGADGDAHADAPLPIFHFHRGTAVLAPRSTLGEHDEPTLRSELQALKSPDLLALKSLSQFLGIPAAMYLGTYLETSHLSELRVHRARAELEAGYAEHLSTEGDNLSLVLEHLQTYHPEVFAEILTRLRHRIPGLTRVDAKVTEEGRVLLRFQDGAFEDPFLARNVSEGTLQMLAYLVLLLDPEPRSLLCVEEPEHHLYPTLLGELAEELRTYSVRGGQVLATTHSPDFLNAIELDEVFWLVKRNGFTEVHRGRNDAQLRTYMADGDKLGYLWKQGLFQHIDPR